MPDIRNILIVVLLIAAATLGYLYYDVKQHGLEVQTPGFGLKAK